MKIKCHKCGLKFKDREDPADSEYKKKLCWNCRFIITVLDLTIQSFKYNSMMGKQLNRDVMLDFENVIIKKKGEI
jgi:hypothetical protein